MKVLWIATKLPWPPRDGGRRLLFDTLRALAEAGHDLTLVAPTLGDEASAARAATELRPFCRLLAVPARLRSRPIDVLRAQLLRRPWTVVRHQLKPMRRRIAAILHEERFDIVQAEQVQALGSLPAELAPPLVWRAQNVESDLWAATARLHRGWRRRFFALEARRLAVLEGARVREAAATVALTREDAARLAELGDGRRVHRIAAPFPPSLPAADRPLPGEPAIVLLGSGGWLPNRHGTDWFVQTVWQRVRDRLPGAVLHVFGGVDPGEYGPAIQRHGPPADSRDAFPPGSLLVVPLDVASGVRIKILEAWARGIPVVATPAAARGLDARDGRELLVARTADDLASALARLHEDPSLREALVRAGRDVLARAHAPERVARAFGAVYSALAPSPGSGSGSCVASST